MTTTPRTPMSTETVKPVSTFSISPLSNGDKKVDLSVALAIVQENQRPDHLAVEAAGTQLIKESKSLPFSYLFSSCYCRRAPMPR